MLERTTYAFYFSHFINNFFNQGKKLSCLIFSKNRMHEIILIASKFSSQILIATFDPFSFTELFCRYRNCSLKVMGINFFLCVFLEQSPVLCRNLKLNLKETLCFTLFVICTPSKCLPSSSHYLEMNAVKWNRHFFTKKVK